MENLHSLTAHGLKELIAKKSADPSKILDSVMTRISQIDGKVKAFVFVNKDGAKDSAAKPRKAVDYPVFQFSSRTISASRAKTRRALPGY